MGSHRKDLKPLPICKSRLFPLTAQEWQHAISVLALTPQQVKIAELILHGHQDKQIASTLKVSKATIRTHLARLFARLGTDDRVQLVLAILVCGRNIQNGVEDSFTTKSFTSK